MQFLRSRFFWLNVIAILVLIVQYFIANLMFTQYILLEGLVVVVLNAIAGMIQGQQVAKLKKAAASRVNPNNPVK